MTVGSVRDARGFDSQDSECQLEPVLLDVNGTCSVSDDSVPDATLSCRSGDEARRNRALGTDGLCGFQPSRGHDARTRTSCPSVASSSGVVLDGDAPPPVSSRARLGRGCDPCRADGVPARPRCLADLRRVHRGWRQRLARRGRAHPWCRVVGPRDEAFGGRPSPGRRAYLDRRSDSRDAFREFLGRRTTWPTQTELDAAGLQGLREVLRHYGGPERWSEELGVALSPKQTPASRPRKRAANPPPVATERRWPKWNDQTIADALRTFLDGRDEWPRYRDFVSSGPPGLYQAVLKHGGSRAWAARLGVKWVRHDGGSAPPWTEERLRERLAVFLNGRTTWPQGAEFAAAGERRLLRAARRIGGTSYWIREFGLRPPDCSPRRVSPTSLSAAGSVANGERADAWRDRPAL